jgi:hypothetical protein
MTMNNEATPKKQTPGEYFDESSFKTLYGGVFITWVTTSIIVDIVGFTDPKILGLIIALMVAFLGFFMSENRSVKKLIVTPFNGFLIYLTIMGGTSFLPPPVPEVAERERAEVVEDREELDEPVEPVVVDRQRSLTLFRAWNPPDQQLVEATRRLQTDKLIAEQRAEQYQQEKEAVQRDVVQLQNERLELQQNQEQLNQLVHRYEVRLDSTRRVLQTVQLTPEQRETIRPLIQMDRPR